MSKTVAETAFWILFRIILAPLVLLPLLPWLAPIALFIYGVVKLIRNPILQRKIFSLITGSADETHLSIWAISGYRLALALVICVLSGWILRRLMLPLARLANRDDSKEPTWGWAVGATFIFSIIFLFFLIALAGSVISTALIVASVVTWPITLSAFWAKLCSFAWNPTNRSILTAASLCFGILLYSVRRRARIAYAAAELVVGVGACWLAFANAKPDQIAGPLALVGGLYSIVRGCDNASQGWRDRKALQASKRMEKEQDRGVDQAKEDIQKGIFRLICFAEQWPLTKPLIDEATGYQVQLLNKTAFGKQMVAQVEAYNNTMREWHVMNANSTDSIETAALTGLQNTEIPECPSAPQV